MASLREYLPFQLKRGRPPKQKAIVTPDDQKFLKRSLKTIGLAIGFTGGTYTGTRVNFEPSPYDFDQIIQAVDTDSYVKQAFNKYRELIWKEGFDIISENNKAAKYIHQRLDFMEISMQMPFTHFMMEVADQLVKFDNAFIVKVRGDLGSHMPGLIKNKGKDPVVGYQLIPAETMEIMRDYHNNVVMYRQNIWGGRVAAVAGFGHEPRQDNLLPTWKPDEVIHFYSDRRPGRIFGTPFIVAVLDDIIALRSMEEDIQNLIHRELFPLFTYTVGTEENPAEPEEIEQASQELSYFRTEGALVLPDRHKVEVVGGEGHALDVQPYLAHFKERVAVGLGLSQHHLGMTTNGGNRSVTDRLDTALYDKIKGYQKTLAQIIQLKILNELLVEGGFDPYTTPDTLGKSDRCLWDFNEIDVDTQVKKENHYLQLWTSDTLTTEEIRIKLNMKPDMDEQQIYSALSQRMLPSPGKPILPSGSSGPTANKGTSPTTPSKSAGGAANTPSKPDAVAPSVGGAPNPVNSVKKAVSNKSMPSNQFGRRSSPNIRHNDDNWLEEVVQLLDDDDDNIV